MISGIRQRADSAWSHSKGKTDFGKKNQTENNEDGEDDKSTGHPGGSRVQAGIHEPPFDSQV